jgi:hypothetical protein
MTVESDYSFDLSQYLSQYDDGYETYPDPSSTYVYGNVPIVGGSGADTISFTSAAAPAPVPQKPVADENVNGFWKFNEGKTMKALDEYLKSTYNSHYTSEKSKVQVLDIIDAIGDGVPFCRDNLIKYASRFGKKNGMSKLDALKIMHYGVLLYHFAGFHTNNSDTYETF